MSQFFAILFFGFVALFLIRDANSFDTIEPILDDTIIFESNNPFDPRDNDEAISDEPFDDEPIET